MSDIVTIEMTGGMVLLVERIPNVSSLALHWLLPVGSAGDPASADGETAMLSELIFRGAGGMSSRDHSDALDRFGVQRSSQTLTNHTRLDATILGERLDDALPLLAMMVRDPALPDDAVDPVRSLCLQSIESLDDDPQHLVMLRLRERHRPAPFNRHGYGDPAALEALDARGLRKAWRDRCVPGGSIFAAAGAVDPEAIARSLEPLLEGWSGTTTQPEESAPAARGYLAVEQETSQVHIGLAYDAPPEADAGSILERIALAILSGSTSGRLFTEVRQKRSLCYSVGASYQPGRDSGLVALYAGTTPQRAQETFDVCLAEIDRLHTGGAERDEFDRALTGLKSNLIMQGESTLARATALGGDQYRLGRARSLDDIAREIDAVTLEALNDYLAAREVGPFTVVSIGPVQLDVSTPTEVAIQ